MANVNEHILNKKLCVKHGKSWIRMELSVEDNNKRIETKTPPLTNQSEQHSVASI